MACEDSDHVDRSFLLIVRTSALSLRSAVAEDARSSQHLARFVLGNVVAELSLLTGEPRTSRESQQLNLELFHNVLNPARVPL